MLLHITNTAWRRVLGDYI